MCLHLCRVSFLGVLFVLIGCGGSGNIAGGGGNGAPQGITMTFTFTGIGNPLAAAVQMGNGPFAPASLNGNVLTFTLPNGTTQYTLAYVCPPFEVTEYDEVIREATVQDGTAITIVCVEGGPGPAPSFGSATGNVDASAIAGAGEFLISGKQGFAGSVNAVSAPFSFNLPTGTNDVAVVVTSSSTTFTTLAARIIRNQTVPGAVNGGNTITLGSGDLLTMQPLNVTNLAAGFLAPALTVSYVTANGTFLLTPDATTNLPQYPVVPAASAQSGDSYVFNASTNNGQPAQSSFLTFSQSTASAGGPFTLALPDPWLYSGPAPAALPTFTFNYSGPPGLSNVLPAAGISWTPSQLGASNIISISATPSFLNGANTVTIPDLSAISGFINPPSGLLVSWIATITGTTGSGLNASSLTVSNKGTYTVP